MTLVMLPGLWAGTGCQPVPPPPAQVVVDLRAPIVLAAPPAKVTATPPQAAVSAVASAADPATAVPVRPTESAAVASEPPFVPRPLTETDPFRTDSLDGNRFGRKLVAVSAQQKRGREDLLEAIYERLPPLPGEDEDRGPGETSLPGVEPRRSLTKPLRPGVLKVTSAPGACTIPRFDRFP